MEKSTRPLVVHMEMVFRSSAQWRPWPVYWLFYPAAVHITEPRGRRCCTPRPRKGRRGTRSRQPRDGHDGRLRLMATGHGRTCPTNKPAWVAGHLHHHGGGKQTRELLRIQMRRGGQRSGQRGFSQQCLADNFLSLHATRTMVGVPHAQLFRNFAAQSNAGGQGTRIMQCT